ncbi:MAG: hypothetical protein J1F22_04905 [Lachnospiraceae bacterium]|nr:hypothetical protein [Lachnospiraceae bacterium]
MKRRYIVISSFFVAFFLLSVFCYGSYRYSEKLAEEKKESVKIKQTGAKQEQKVNSDTKYILEIYNEDTEALAREEHNMPSEYNGMTRKTLEDYLKQCVQAMAADDKEAGLSDMNLVSFSSEEIVIRKSYREPVQEKGFFLRILEGEVAIYDRAGKTLYEKTGISVENIPEEEVKKLKKGYIVEDEKDLYSILENFSS